MSTPRITRTHLREARLFLAQYEQLPPEVKATTTPVGWLAAQPGYSRTRAEQLERAARNTRPHSRKFTAKQNPRRYLLSGIPPRFWADLRRQAKLEHVSVRALILTLLERWLDEAPARGTAPVRASGPATEPLDPATEPRLPPDGDVPDEGAEQPEDEDEDDDDPQDDLDRRGHRDVGLDQVQDEAEDDEQHDQGDETHEPLL